MCLVTQSDTAAVAKSLYSLRPRDRTHGFCVSYIGRWILYYFATWEVLYRGELYYNLNFLSHEMGQLRSKCIVVIKSTYIRAKPPGSKPRLIHCEHDLGQLTPPFCVLDFSFGDENDNSHTYFQVSDGCHKH